MICAIRNRIICLRRGHDPQASTLSHDGGELTIKWSDGTVERRTIGPCIRRWLSCARCGKRWVEEAVVREKREAREKDNA